MAIKTYIPNTGRNLIAQALAQGKAIKFTSAKLGTGTAGTEQQILAYTDLVDTYASAVLGDREYSGNATCKFSVQFTTSGITTTVLITEIGIFAKINDADTPVLFSYTTFGSDADRLFPNSEASIYRIYNVAVSFTVGSGGVSVTINPDALIKASQASETATAGKLLYADSNAKLPADITGSAAMLGGQLPSYYATATHSHAIATQSAAGFESAEDKTNLDTLVGRVDQDLKTTASPTFAGLTVNGFIEGAAFH